MPLAALLDAPRRLRVVDRPSPVAGPGEVLVRIRCAGICGTDLAIWGGDYAVPLPLVPGHEWCGERVGAQGGRVVGEINRHCAARGVPPCPLCAAGHPAHCTTRTVTGIAGADGAFQEYLAVPAALLHAVPDAVTDEAAVFVEPLAAALRTFALSPLAPGACVALIGAGRLGLLAGLAAQRLGARVLAIARSAEGAHRAGRFGLEALAWDTAGRVPPPDPLAAAPSAARERVLALSGGRGADLVIEACGAPEGLAAALDLVRPRGTVALKSTPGRPARFDLTRAVVHEITLQGSRCGPFDAALDWLARTPLPLGELVAARFPLREAAAAFEHAAHAPGKTLLTP